MTQRELAQLIKSCPRGRTLANTPPATTGASYQLWRAAIRDMRPTAEERAAYDARLKRDAAEAEAKAEAKKKRRAA
jgi:signal transduction histidine kinase